MKISSLNWAACDYSSVVSLKLNPDLSGKSVKVIKTIVSAPAKQIKQRKAMCGVKTWWPRDKKAHESRWWGIINLCAGMKWLLSLGVSLRLQLHDRDCGTNSAAENKGSVNCSFTACRWMRPDSAHLHGLHGVVSKVMDVLPLCLWVWVTKSCYVDNVAIVEGNKHSKDAGGRVHGILKKMSLKLAS